MTMDDKNLSLQLAGAFQAACLAELEALKPGNVHIFADGHGMRVQDFMRSAEAAAIFIAKPELTVGQRISFAIHASCKEVGCNTNLGIVLLCAPLIHARLHGSKPTLRENLQQVLGHLTVADAELVYAAIARAAPGGLGESARHDVHAKPTVTLLEAMREAATRDRIAAQYAHGFADIFDFGLAQYQRALQRWQRPAWATTLLYLSFMSRFVDSHIVRKYGEEAAQKVKTEAGIHEQALLALENPKSYQRRLLQFDADLKLRGLNPGTSADLTVATLLTGALQAPTFANS
ncbi:MAG TPA: triphosphoribosyl-dephospho-CoA synthase [Methylophilaceae bacterium]|nr:triphosphoribosyl-dephospho-CoA synthase [Methylophilaceae bacterium]